MCPINEYEQKLEERRQRYLELAEKNRKESTRRSQASHDAVAHIPPGQPILVGHHSEAAHRRALQRSWDNMGKSVEASNKAEYYEQKAASVGKGGISSDDPEALAKLREKLAGMRERQATMKQVNKVYRAFKKKGEAAFEDCGLSDKLIQTIRTWKPDYAFEKAPIQPWAFQNLNQNIKRVEKRIEQLEARQDAETKFEKVGDVWIVENTEANRVQIYFPDKPDADTRTMLKRHGFRWSPRAEWESPDGWESGAWQAFLPVSWNAQAGIEKLKESL